MSHKACFKTEPQPDLVCGGCDSHFQIGWQMECSMSHISGNIIDRKLSIVSMSMCSGSINPNMAIILCQPLFFNMAAIVYVLNM